MSRERLVNRIVIEHVSHELFGRPAPFLLPPCPFTLYGGISSLIITRLDYDLILLAM